MNKILHVTKLLCIDTVFTKKILHVDTVSTNKAMLNVQDAYCDNLC